MRSDRLLSALLLLQAHGRLTGRELSQRLEVSARTIHRDMEALSAAGVPVLALRGSGGGWQLDENWRTQVPGLSEPELQALLMAQPSVIGDTRLAAAAERALEKLMAALPTNLRDRATSIRQRLYVDSTGWRASTEDLSALPVVQDALSIDRKLSILYRQPGREAVERIVDPLGLIAKGNTWYLFAQTPNGPRTYTVSRIQSASIVDQPSERPADFDLATAWKTSTRSYAEQRPHFLATLRVDPSIAAWMVDWHAATPLDPPAMSPRPGTEDWKTLRIQFDHEREAHFYALGLSLHAEVLEPPSLRNKIQSDIAELLRRHPQPQPAGLST